MNINNSIIAITLIAMASVATWHSISHHKAEAGYRSCLMQQPGARKGNSLVFAHHSEWLQADNACKPY